MADLLDEPEGGAERRQSVTVEQTEFVKGGPDLDQVRKCLDYLAGLWPELAGANPDRWAMQLSGGLTDRDYRRGCEAARKAKELGQGPPDPATFRLWIHGASLPTRKASESTRREAVDRIKARLSGREVD